MSASRVNPKFLWFVAIAATSQLLLPPPTDASMSRPITVEQIVSRADLVLEADVVDGWLELYDEALNVWVWRYQLDVVQSYKGSVSSGTVLLTVPAGCDGEGREMSVSGAPRLSFGERVLVPVRVIDEQTVGAYSWGAGFLRVGSSNAGENFVYDAEGRLVTDYPCSGHRVDAPGLLKSPQRRTA